jgi:hypothetical protein
MIFEKEISINEKVINKNEENIKINRLEIRLNKDDFNDNHLQSEPVVQPKPHGRPPKNKSTTKTHAHHTHRAIASFQKDQKITVRLDRSCWTL